MKIPKPLPPPPDPDQEVLTTLEAAGYLRISDKPVGLDPARRWPPFFQVRQTIPLLQSGTAGVDDQSTTGSRRGMSEKPGNDRDAASQPLRIRFAVR